MLICATTVVSYKWLVVCTICAWIADPPKSKISIWCIACARPSDGPVCAGCEFLASTTAQNIAKIGHSSYLNHHHSFGITAHPPQYPCILLTVYLSTGKTIGWGHPRWVVGYYGYGYTRQRGFRKWRCDSDIADMLECTQVRVQVHDCTIIY